VPLVHLSTPAVVAGNVLAWGLIHAGTGYLVHRLPVARLQRDGALLRERRVERGGRLYERLGIRRWKDRLPEAGALFAGGVSKRAIPGRGGLERFVVETRRAELGHWLAMAGGPLAAIWNPPAGTVLMVAYGVAVNAPFIAVQRYNRIRSLRVLRRAADRSSTSTPDAEDRSRANGSSMP
jgi:glycosyl-4,4'-diaponeurosporenoate acyltransferase